MNQWMIEGEWSGPVNPAGDWTRIVHREFTTDQDRADACRALGSILYTDGTRLFLSVTSSDRRALPLLDGYGRLITDCIAQGVSSVDELEKP